MAKFRKKPVVIEAVRWNAETKNFDEVMNFMQDFHGNKLNYENAEELAYKSKELHIRTLEGVMTASNLDWIIKGVNGEFYPCKPDIFEKTYEAVEEESFVGRRMLGVGCPTVATNGWGYPKAGTFTTKPMLEEPLYKYNTIFHSKHHCPAFG